MIKTENGIIKVTGSDYNILEDIATFLIAISTNRELNKHLEKAARIADKYIKEELDVSHDSSN